MENLEISIIQDLGMIGTGTFRKDNGKERFSRYYRCKCPTCSTEFTTRADNVKNGRTTECKECMVKRKTIVRKRAHVLATTKTTEQFVRDAKIVHGDKYDYTETQYVRSKSKVSIKCNTHGNVLNITPNAHLMGVGCPICGYETVSTKLGLSKSGWSYTDWECAGMNSKLFDSFKVYIIECYDDNERFIKIGKTFTTIQKRFYGVSLPYDYKILKVVEGSARFVSELETELHRNLRDNGLAYMPMKEFGGRYECFSCNYKEEII